MKTLYFVLFISLLQLLSFNPLSAQPNGYLTCAEAVDNVICDMNDIALYDTDIFTNPNFNVNSNCTLEEGVAGKATFLAYVQGPGDGVIQVMFNGSTCNTSGHSFNVQLYRYNEADCFMEQVFCATDQTSLELPENYSQIGILYVIALGENGSGDCQVTFDLSFQNTPYEVPQNAFPYVTNYQQNYCTDKLLNFKVWSPYNYLNNTNVTTFNWSIRDAQDNIIDDFLTLGNPGLQTKVNTLDYTFTQPGFYQICVDEINHPCSSAVGLECHSINVVLPLQNENFGTVFLCEENLSTYTGPFYLNDDPNETSDPNNDGTDGWQAELFNFQFGYNEVIIENYEEGCEYIQSVFIEQFPSYPIEDNDIAICNPSDFPVTIFGQEFNNTVIDLYYTAEDQGNYGCDSIVSLSIVLLHIDGEIVIDSCYDDKYILKFISTTVSNPYQRPIIYTWLDSLGNVIDSGIDLNTVTVDSADQYFLDINISSFFNSNNEDVTCTHSFNIDFDKDDYVGDENKFNWEKHLCSTDTIVSYLVKTDTADNTIYTWEYPTDAILVDSIYNDTLTLDWSMSQGGRVCVSYLGPCGVLVTHCDTISRVSLPIPIIDRDTTLCALEENIFNYNGPLDSTFTYFWDFGTLTPKNGNDNGPGPFILEEEVGTSAIINLRIEQFGCQSNTIYDTLNFIDCTNQDPIPYASKSTICINDTASVINHTFYTVTIQTPTILTFIDGIITGINAGVGEITLTGSNNYSKTITIQVQPLPVVSLGSVLEIVPVASTQLSPAIGGTWQSSDNNVASVTNSGLVTGISVGKVSFEFSDLSTGCSNSTDLLCIVKDTTPILDKFEFCIGESGTITYYELYIITVEDNTILNFSNGIVTALKEGTTLVTLTDPNAVIVAQFSIEVFPAPIIEISGSTIITIGEQTQLTANTSGVWTSLVPSVASINSNGIVTGKTEGMSTFMFTDSKGCKSEESDPVFVTNGIYYLSGYAFIDANNDGIFDANEYPLPNFRIRDLTRNTTIFTNNDGYYELRVTPTIYNFNVSSTYANWVQSSYNVDITITSQNTSLDFPFIAVPSEITGDAIVNSGILRCNTHALLNVSALNTSNDRMSGTMEIVFDPSTISYEFDPQPTKIANNIYTYDFQDINPGLSFSPKIRIGIPPFFPMQDSMTFDVVIRDEEGNVLDIMEYTDLIRCSYDPNDKRSWPDRPGDENHILAGEIIDYTIRFQNNGNDTAFYVEVVDVISPYLDPSSITLRESSHDMKVQIHMDSVFFIFDPIALVDSTTNFEASQGFISFSIMASENIDAGELVQNKAAIIFDKNDPIITNSTLNTVVDILPCYHISNIINQDGNTLIADDQGLNYQWIDCEDGTVAFESTESVFTPVFNGLYQIIIDGDNCQNVTDCYSITLSNTAETDLNAIRVYPNPSSGFLTIRDEYIHKSAIFTNLLGQEVEMEVIKNQVDISILASGIYLLKLHKNGEEFVKKVVKI